MGNFDVVCPYTGVECSSWSASKTPCEYCSYRNPRTKYYQSQEVGYNNGVYSITTQVSNKPVASVARIQRSK